MGSSLIDISGNGAIKLGQDVTCDGFVSGFKYRVQTHIHLDHMSGFNASKGYQDIIMSEATKDLLALEHVDIPNRSNIIALPIGEEHCDGGLKIELKSSSHMLGAMQVAVITSTGDRIGYSGDISWPLDDIIKVEQLVVDSTYGTPNSVRRYSQQEACDCFKEIVIEKIKSGPIIIWANRGTLHRALGLLDELVTCPIIVKRKKIAEAEVYQRYGRPICPLMALESPDVRKLRKEGPYIELYYKSEQLLYEPKNSTTIDLTAFWIKSEEPCLELADSVYRIGISDHADFGETLEYVRETEAKVVLAVNQINVKSAGRLASAITKRLGISAKPAKPVYSRAWGV